MCEILLDVPQEDGDHSSDSYVGGRRNSKPSMKPRKQKIMKAMAD